MAFQHRKSKGISREVSSPCGCLRPPFRILLIGPRLEHRTRCNRPLTARQQLLVFLHFLGTNSFYHLMYSCHGSSTSTVWHIIHRIVPVILSFKREFIQWPDQPLSIAAKFRDIAGFPRVAGCFDGTHILVNLPHNDEDAYVNHHHSKSLNGSRPRLHHLLL